MKRMVLMVIMTVLVMFGVCDTDEDYIDPVIDMLLNGVGEVVTNSTEVSNDKESVLTGGIWKCGNCTDLGTAQLVHSDTNLFDADMDVQKVEVQINLELAGMRCVTVTSEQPGAVQKLLGTCEGSSVTLSVSPNHNFTVLVYM